ncbi:MAG: hypothetical protein VX747_06750 [Actinomycetota bacterium]|nr:hypothetical protein [Actinomycetota bacterium]
MPELLFDECAPAPIARAATEMLSRADAGRAQAGAARRAACALAPRPDADADSNGPPPVSAVHAPGAPLAPSTLAAQAVLRAIDARTGRASSEATPACV